MRDRGRVWQPLSAAVLALALSVCVPTLASGVTLRSKLLAKVGYGQEAPNFVRTKDGVLHLALETDKNWGDAANGVGTLSISPSGHIGAFVQALSWGPPTGGSPNGIPGLAVTPTGTLVAAFGGSPSSDGGDPGPWAIASANGGATWSAPGDVGSGSMEQGDSNMTLQITPGGTPVMTAGCCGGIVVQQGFGPGAPTYLLTNSNDGAAGNTTSALDSATGAVVAGWGSNAGTGGIWMQQIAPVQGAATKMPIPSEYSTGLALILAGRDTGPGVFAAYPSNFGPTTKIRLLRYGGSSVAVGSVKGMHASVVGVAPGPDGRMWVIWYGQLGNGFEIAITRSNRAVTRFGPIQTFKSTWSSLSTLSGDGRLGPLDLLIGGSPQLKTGIAPTGIYYARLFSALSAKVSVKKLNAKKFKVSVTVKDAGDPVSGAKVSVNGHKAITNAKGKAKLVVKGSSGDHLSVRITDSGYRGLKQKITL